MTTALCSGIWIWTVFSGLKHAARCVNRCRTGPRRATLRLSLAVLLLPAPAVQAQRLLTLVPGAGQASSAGDSAPSIGLAPVAVQVDLDLLRGDPARLEMPTPDGRVLSADRSVFEERGNGDLMWSGGQRGAGYDTVVLTVEGGRLVGRVAAAGGAAYQIHTERDGLGGMVPVGGSRAEGSAPFCGVDGFGGTGVQAGARALVAHPPEPASSPQGYGRLDILVAYTAKAAENWADRGGPLASIRHAGDYLRMVFRNNLIEVEPRIVHIVRASSALDRAGRDLGMNAVPGEGDGIAALRPLDFQLRRDGELEHLRHEHGADIVHLFTGESALLLGACGSAFLLGRGGTAEGFGGLARGWTTNHPDGCPGGYAVTFVHEVGHNLGAHHDPSGVESRDQLFRPYAIGHADPDVMPSFGTAMSYRGHVEPLFSTPRIRAHGAVLGIPEKQDNERLLHETVRIAVRYSDYLPSLEGVPARPTDLEVRFDDGVAHLSWRDNAFDADGYVVSYWERTGAESGDVQAESRTGAAIPLRITEPGSHFNFLVRATKGDVWSLRSDIVRLVIPGVPIAAPSDVFITLTNNQALLKVHWTDNSDNESGFDVQLLQGGDPIARQRAAADSQISDWFWPGHVSARGDTEYEVRVFAYNDSGYSASSEVETFRWQHPDAPAPAAGLSVSAIDPTTVRVTWRSEPEVVRYYLSAHLLDWRDNRFSWTPSVGAGSIWRDFEGLARGARYEFRVKPYAGQNSPVESRVYLTLGERGAGPRPPSNLSRSKMADGRTLLTWKDNSSDELGFEVQVQAGQFFGGFKRWRRVLTVPPDTESAVVERVHADGFFRVFAYNERGFSRRASGGPPPAETGGPSPIVNLMATAGAGDVRLTWLVAAWAAPPSGMQVRWKRSSELPFDDAAEAWTDLPASAREHTVAGFRDATEYTFAVRALSASGVGPVSTTRATPSLPTPELSVAAAGASESAGAVVFDVRLSWSSESMVTVDYATSDRAGASGAKAGEDYTATAGTLTFAPGALVEPIRVPVTNDGRYEAAPETFTLTLQRPTNATFAGGAAMLSVTGTIHDDDDGPPTAAFELFGAACDDQLCLAATGEPVRFVDTSSGKVLSRLWVFGDGTTSDSPDVEHSWSSPGFYEAALSVSDGTSGSTESRKFLVDASEPRGTCRSDAETRCLQDSRYAVSIDWWTSDSASGRGSVVHEGTNESGLFRFFSRENWEVLVKVLDGCAINERIWVLGASTTDLGYRILVSDTVTRESRAYANEPGRPAPAIMDTEAFPCGPGAAVQ